MKLPAWVGDRDYLVLKGTRVVAAFWIKERAEAYAAKRNLTVVER